MTNTLNMIREAARQRVTQDENFYKRFLYYFELKLPDQFPSGNITPGKSNNFMFPLILPPEAITLDEPFSVELTPTQRGGLYAEENGIIQRTIRIRGNTGFKPRALKTYGSFGSNPPGLTAAIPQFVFPQSVSHSRKLPRVAKGDISGHRHFQYLQDSVFRMYADLKRDPVTAQHTEMYFHNPKDDEHWTVIPRRFTLDRDKSKPVLYDYNIELTIVGPADKGPDLDFDDKSWLDAFNNAIYMANLGAQVTAGAINDLTAMAADIQTQVSNIATLIDGATTVLNATQDFIDGTKPFIDVPHAWTVSWAEQFEAAAALTFEDPNQTVPPFVTNSMRKAVDGLEMITSNPSSFSTPNDDKMSGIRDNQELRRTVTQERQTEITDAGGPSSYIELEALGTGLTPGEVESSAGNITAGGNVIRFRNSQEITVGYGDTLASLAAQYLGDARLWQYIATANGLNPPYVDIYASSPLNNAGADESPFPHSLGVGSKILIPSNAASPVNYPLLPVLGTQLSESSENQLLGIDAMLEVEKGFVGDSNAVYDVPIDVDGGSVDVKQVEGLDNIAQVIIMRLVTESGTDTMYKNVGLKRIVGLNFKISDFENARYRIRESILSDARIATLDDLNFEQVDDALVAELNATLRGFAETRPVKVEL